MKKNVAGMLALSVFLWTTAVISPAFADENEVTALRDQVKDLNEKVATLEHMVTTMQGHISATQGKESLGTYVAPTQEVPGGLIHTLQDIHMGGYVDTQYSMALNDSTDHRTAAGLLNRPTNRGRVFDGYQDSFVVNAVELDFEKAANPEGGAGFRVDIQYGEDAEIVDFDANADQASGVEDDLHLQQAYVEYVQPLHMWDGHEILPASIGIKAGRFVTLAGAEVIEAKDNWNISRSFGFGMAIPFTHTGVRTNFKMFKDFFDVYLGLVNGWDVNIDNNRGKTGEMGLGYTLFENLSMFHAIYIGPERNDTVGQKRFLLSNVATFNATEALAFKAEINFGHENHVGPTAAPFASNGENIEYGNYAGYARYQINDKWAAAYRAELFRDDALSRAGATALFTAPDNTLFEQTVTLEYLLADNLISRFEYRWDKSNNTGSFDLDSNQQTLGAQLIYNFA